MAKDIHEKSIRKFKNRNTVKDEEGYFIMIEGLVHQESIQS
jgi:hypothetical protein